MSKSILILGHSGSGKSTSVETLNSKETFIIRCTDKSLPFKGWKTLYTPVIFNESKTESKGNLYTSHISSNIINMLQHINTKRLDIKYVIIDDSQYNMSFAYMSKAKETGYQKFTDIAKDAFDMFNVGSKLRDDLFVFYMNHNEEFTDADGVLRCKIKTIGKLLDDKITLEGLFTIVLQTEVSTDDKNIINYNFITQTNGKNTCKSPKGMFDYKIPNNLQYVVSKINEYEN